MLASSKQMIKRVEKDGWVFVGAKGSHHQFKHSSKPGRVTIPHPKKELTPGTVNSVLRQAGLK